MKLEVEVKDCRDCPMRHSHRGHGECWEECCHPEFPGGAYDNILWGCQESFKEIPKLCPLKKKEQTDPQDAACGTS